jgi:hypothetical protein
MSAGLVDFQDDRIRVGDAGEFFDPQCPGFFRFRQFRLGVSPLGKQENRTGMAEPWA